MDEVLEIGVMMMSKLKNLYGSNFLMTFNLIFSDLYLLLFKSINISFQSSHEDKYTVASSRKNKINESTEFFSFGMLNNNEKLCSVQLKIAVFTDLLYK